MSSIPMTIRPEQPLQKIINKQLAALPGMNGKIQELIRLNQIWRLELDPDLVTHSRIANFRDECLIIELDSSAWAMRLRYLIPELLKQLRVHQELKSLLAIEWYINPIFPDHSGQTRQPLILSAASRKLIHETAITVSNKTLQQALCRLAGIL